MKKINGNSIAGEIYEDLELRVVQLKKKKVIPKMAVFFVDGNKAIKSYINKKQEKAEQLGLSVDLNRWQEGMSTAEAVSKIKQAVRQDVHGILVQLPVPKSVDTDTVLAAVPADIDIDGIGKTNFQALVSGSYEQVKFFPPAPSAVIEILNKEVKGWTNKEILIVGTGRLVGKPLAGMMLGKGVNFKLANIYTENIHKLIKESDIVISAVGKNHLHNADDFKSGAVVIDAGTTAAESGQISGDVNPEGLEKVVSKAALVPGGVGPVTVAKLLENLVISAECKS